MTAVRWFIGIMATILGLTAAFVIAIGLIIGTESGTRWALGVAAERAPGRLSIREPEGTLLGGLRLAALEWRDEATAVEAERVHVNVDLLPLLSRRIDVKRLAAQSFRLQLAGAEDEDAEAAPVDVDLPITISVEAASFDTISIVRGQTAYAFTDTVFTASLAGQRLDIASIRTSGFGIDVAAAVRIRLAGNLPLRLDGSWRQPADQSPGLAGSVRLRGNLEELLVEHELASPFVVVSRGSLGLTAGELEFDIDNRWDRVAWTFDGQQLEADAGTLGLQGTLDALDIEFETRARFADYPPTNIELSATTDLETLEIRRLVAENAWGAGEFSGSVARQPVIAAEIDFRLTRVDPSQFLAGLSGALAAQGSASLRLEDGLTLGVRADNIEGLLNGRFLTASTAFEYTPPLLDFQYAEFRVGRNTLRARGRVAESLAVDAVLELDAIGDLVPEASGTAKASITLSDRLAAPTAEIEITGEQIAYGAFATDELRLAISGSMPEHAIDATLLRDGIRLDVLAAGGYAAQAWAGDVESVVLEGDRVGRWSSRRSAAVGAGPSGVVVDGLCLVGSADGTVACATVGHSPGGASEFDLSVEGLPVAALPFRVPPGVTVSGTLAANARGRLEDGSLSATAEVRAAEAALAAEYEGEEARLVFDEAFGTATVDANRLESAVTIRLGDDAGEIEGALTAADVFDADAAIGGQLGVSIRDAGMFAVFVPSIVNPRGSIDGRLEISGSRAAPGLLGAIELRDGAFAVRPAGIEVREISLRAEQLAAGELRLSGSARSGEGHVSISGKTFAGTGTGLRSEVTVNGDDFELFRLPDWRMTASPAIDIVFDERAAVVSGKLTIPAADIRVKAIPETAVRVSPDATIHTAGATEFHPGRQIDIDVDTVLGDAVRFDGFGLTTRLAGAVRVQGGTRRPYLGFGQLDLREGRYAAYGQELTIERGQLIFNGPLNTPNLDVRAIRRVDDVVAGIQVTGQPSRLRSEVFSEPPLSDAETLSYLLTGRPLTGATTSAEGDLLNKAAFALGMSQAGSVVSQIGGTLGLETLSVEGGAESGRIVAGKRIGGRLLVEYGYGIVDKLGTLLLRYQINRRLVLESRTGTVSNLDIVYSVKKQ